MPHHPALEPRRGAVVTGAASGIGLATAERLAALGMRVCLADIDAEALGAAKTQVRRQARGATDVIAVTTDVSRPEDVARLKATAFEAFGDVAFLMNNAGAEGGGALFGSPERWRAILGVNLWGVINGIQVFGPAMIAQGRPGAIVSTGSKQGITTPPGDTAIAV